MPRARSAKLVAGPVLLVLLYTAFAPLTAEPPQLGPTGSEVIAAGADSPATAEGIPLDVAMSTLDGLDDVALSTEAALRALAPAVARMSHSDALRTAFAAYYRYRSTHPDEVRKPFFYYVDLGLGNGTARGYVFDMDRLSVVDGPFTVAHGRGSSKTRNGVPTSFSNRPGSYASSLGLYLAQETYTFIGKSGGRRYSSVGLRMRGESAEFNDAARARGIVAHGAPYVTAREAGRSEGCPAMEQDRARRLLPMLAHGGVAFLYSPNDPRWLTRDPWVNGDM